MLELAKRSAAERIRASIATRSPTVLTRRRDCGKLSPLRAELCPKQSPLTPVRVWGFFYAQNLLPPSAPCLHGRGFRISGGLRDRTNIVALLRRPSGGHSPGSND